MFCPINVQDLDQSNWQVLIPGGRRCLSVGQGGGNTEKAGCYIVSPPHNLWIGLDKGELENYSAINSRIFKDVHIIWPNNFTSRSIKEINRCCKRTLLTEIVITELFIIVKNKRRKPFPFSKYFLSIYSVTGNLLGGWGTSIKK